MSTQHDSALIDALEGLVRRIVREELAELAARTPPSPYMSVTEAATYLRCSRQRIDNLLSAGHLERVKDGSRTLVRRSDLDRYLGER